MRKKILLAVFTFLFSFVNLKADEGMWLPFLLKQLNATDMQTRGLQIPVDSIYAVNKSSLKDAVVLFGGGCTGEIISDKGLLLTNHHCGYGQIQSHSTVEKDYLTDGYWAKTYNDELACKGLTASFIVRIDDVTNDIIPALNSKMTEAEREATISTIASALEKKATEGTHYEARVRPFFTGNKYFMIVSETFKDVRLVGTPPSAIGKFGADADNWMWPRHTGDFALFRIYAGKDNKPAEYAADNVPYIPRYSFPISLNGVSEGDFTMVYGFPGRTNEYLSSYALELIMNHTDPIRIALRDVRLKNMAEVMRDNDTVRIQYSAKYAGIENAYKKWKGELRGLKRLNSIEKKRKTESAFGGWLDGSADRNNNYGRLMSDLKNAYKELTPYSIASDYINEGAYGIELLAYARNYVALADSAANKTTSKEWIKKECDRLIDVSKGFYKDYHAPLDEKIAAELLEAYFKKTDKQFHPYIFDEVNTKYKNDFAKYMSDVFSKSFMTTQQEQEAFLKNFTAKKLLADPAYLLMKSFEDVNKEKVSGQFAKAVAAISILQRKYMAAQMEMQPDKKFYPDANSTLRVAYGNVKSYKPMNAVTYNYFTTADGIIEKYDSTNYDFNAPKKLLQLIAKKDFGRYAKDGELPLCFIATNHTTGGNSGSPVLNANGQLIGTNFDRVWEGTMSDYMFDPDQCRNITLDIRYTLFVIDKFANAQRLIDELKIVQ